MQRYCAYCKIYLGEKEPFDNQEISHGICSVCLAIELERYKKYFKEVEKKTWQRF